MKIGIDIGGTRVKIAHISAAGRVEGLRLVAMTEAGCTPTGLVDLLARTCREVAGSEEIEGIGVGVPGILAAAEGRVVESPNLGWLNGFGLGAALGEACGTACRVDNDANCVIWGEAVVGAGRGCSDLVGLALGTGVGGGIVLGGRLYRGPSGRAGELGHLCIEPSGPPCGCGGRGCLEQYASQTGLIRLLRERGLLEAGRFRGADSQDPVVGLFRAAAAGDGAALAVVEVAGRALGQAMAAFFNVLDVPVFVVAGGIAASLDLLRPAISAGIADHLFASLRAEVRILAGVLGPDAGCIGAACLLGETAPSARARRNRE